MLLWAILPSTYVESYDIKKKNHFIQRLNVHLQGHYLIQNISQAQKDFVDIWQQGSKLEAYFRHDKALKQTKNQKFLYYWEIAEQNKWNGKTNIWEQGIHELCVIRQIHNVNFVAHPECFICEHFCIMLKMQQVLKIWQQLITLFIPQKKKHAWFMVLNSTINSGLTP